MIDISNITTCFDSPATMEAIIRGMRNPMNSWALSDSGICKGGDSGISCDKCHDGIIFTCDHQFDHKFKLGALDHNLMSQLAQAGSSHSKYRRMMSVYLDILAPLYWWKEFDTYKVGTVANSCSTMHKIHSKEFTPGDFSGEHLLTPDILDLVGDDLDIKNRVPELAGIAIGENGAVGYVSPWFFLRMTCGVLNRYRNLYLETKDKRYWWQMDSASSVFLQPEAYSDAQL